ncbi:MAG: heat-inducible transcriptional repressor HrcA [Polyangiales bacterium]
MNFALNPRKRRILFATITEYIATGKPVGSRTIAKRYGIPLSPATIRNALADLEDTGYLHQPHLSAGRVPTNLGFRCFVDALATATDVDDAHRSVVLNKLASVKPGTDLMTQTAELLSWLTSSATVITPPDPANESLQQLRLMQLQPNRVLVVIATVSGLVENRIVITTQQFSPDDLQRLNNYLDELRGERSLRGVRDALHDRVNADRGQAAGMRAVLSEIFDAAMNSAPNSAPFVISRPEGVFDRPEFGNAETIRRFLHALDDKERLLHLLDTTLETEGVQVAIGNETQLANGNDISVISTRYTRNGEAIGSVGIVGPTRMDYPKFIPLVGFTADVMSRILAGDTTSTETEDDSPL